jgi:hypothetical protein
MLKTIWRHIANVLLFCYLFLIAYGTLRAGIDKLIERRNSKKNKILSELISTKEGREKLTKTMIELAEKGDTK